MSLRGDILADKLIYFQNDDTPSPPHSPDSETETNLPDVETLRLEGDTDEEDEEDDNENTYKPMKIVTRKEEEEERMRQNKRPIGVGTVQHSQTLKGRTRLPSSHEGARRTTRL